MGMSKFEYISSLGSLALVTCDVPGQAQGFAYLLIPTWFGVQLLFGAPLPKDVNAHLQILSGHATLGCHTEGRQKNIY